MSGQVALKLVRPQDFDTIYENLDFSTNTIQHSLHSVINLGKKPFSFGANYFIKKYSKPLDTIFDPFCSVGTAALEAALLNRYVVASDINPLKIKIATGKLNAQNFADFLLNVQFVNLRSLVKVPAIGLEHFFDQKTLYEIINLALICRKSNNSFMELLALALLHGKSTGCFSMPTFAQYAISSEEQKRINLEWRQFPEYRAILPRLIKKAANVLRDGLPSCYYQNIKQHKAFEANAINLGFLKSDSIDLVYASPPVPNNTKFKNQWLRNWFAGIHDNEWEAESFNSDNLSAWLDFCNTVILELVRIIKYDSRIVLELPKEDRLAKVLEQYASTNLGNYLRVEALYSGTGSANAVKGLEKESYPDFLVLRKV